MMSMQTKADKQQGATFFQKVIRSLDSVSFGIRKERNYLLENISMLAAGGMTVLSAISAVRQEVRSRVMHRILDTLQEDVEVGLPLWKAFERSKIFRDHTISLVRIGEESGRLSENLKLVAAQEAKERDFRSKIQGAMLYPVFVLSLTVIVGVLIAWFILPRLATVFSQLDVDLPSITKGLIAAGTFLGEYGHIALPVFVGVLGLLIFFLFFFSKTKFIGQTILFFLPGIHRLIQEVELARFGYLLGTLLRAGIPITTALDSLEKATVFPQYKKLYAYLRDSIGDGNSFQKSFVGYARTQKLISIPIQQLIVAGEQSGNLPEALLTISVSFESKTEQTTKNISIILEPVLLVIVWLGVVAVALAVILPIYSLIGGLNTDPSQRMQQDVPIEEPRISLPPESVTEPVIEDVPPMMLRILEADIEYLNVRDDSSTDGEILGRAYPGEEYEYLDEREGWYQIVFGGFEYGVWIYGDYVEIIETKTE